MRAYRCHSTTRRTHTVVTVGHRPSITHAGAAASCTTASSPANSYSSARGRREHSPLDAAACRLERAPPRARCRRSAQSSLEARPGSWAKIASSGFITVILVSLLTRKPFYSTICHSRRHASIPLSQQGQHDARAQHRTHTVATVRYVTKPVTNAARNQARRPSP